MLLHIRMTKMCGLECWKLYVNNTFSGHEAMSPNGVISIAREKFAGLPIYQFTGKSVKLVA